MNIFKVKLSYLLIFKYFKIHRTYVPSLCFSVPGRVMEAKSLVVFLLVSCVFLSTCLQPASSQGLRWGREFENENPKIEKVKEDYLRRKQMQESFVDSTEKGEKKVGTNTVFYNAIFQFPISNRAKTQNPFALIRIYNVLSIWKHSS